MPTDARGRVEAFVEKPPRDEAPTDLINAGFYVLESGALDRIPPGVKLNIERVTFPAMVADRSLYARADDAYWIDVGTPERYLQANLAAHDRSWVAPTAKVAPNATVRESVVLDGATISDRAWVERSIVGRDATIGEGAAISDLTVIGDGVRIDGGASLHGVRVPEPT